MQTRTHNALLLPRGGGYVTPPPLRPPQRDQLFPPPRLLHPDPSTLTRLLHPDPTSNIANTPFYEMTPERIISLWSLMMNI
ncbi:hypothetical protein EYF80_064315 [Liparis tanakae]|uniref:Uncharacterized protein n=1 Tax=Liparis tanakae TaxID=230148 RepID=A0A4Z2EAI9_9TELE|nr:hypothetical protein EYF80_064315 [Liparis tanakae]